MGTMLGAGVLLIAYSPVTCVILGYTARRSALLVLTIASAFAWLMAILLASLIWLAIPPLKSTHAWTAAVSSLCQEGLRWLVVWAYVKAEDRVLALARAAPPRPHGHHAHGVPALLFNDLSAAIACGAGFGAMHIVMAYGAMLGTAVTSDAAFYWPACPGVSAYVTTAVTALLYSVLHVALMVVALDAWRTAQAADAASGSAAASRGGSGARPQPWELGLLFTAPQVLHVAFAEGTLLSSSSACAGTIPLLAALAGAAAALAVWRVRRPTFAAKRQMTVGAQIEAAARSAAAAAAGSAGRGEWQHLPATPASDAGDASAAAAAASGVTRNPTFGVPTPTKRAAAGGGGERQYQQQQPAGSVT